MRWMETWALVGAMLLIPGCAKEQPTLVRDEQLGIAVTFPGEPQKVRYVEPTPFGPVEWFGRAYRPAGRMDTSFQVEAGNLPAGTEGGGTPGEIVETYHRWLVQRFGKVEREELPPEKGPGFRYLTVSPMGTRSFGVVVVRRGRLHRAVATVDKAEEARARAFVDGFLVQ